MPWFSPDVTDAELIFWSIPHNVSVITPVPRWPQPNGPRVAAEFRSTRMFTRWPDAILSRYLVRMETGVQVGGPPPVAKNAWGWLDLGVIDDDTLQGETGEDEDGFNFRFTLRQFDNLPVAAAAGIESTIELLRSGEFWRVRREHVASQSSSGWRWNYTWQGIVQAGVSSEDESQAWLYDTEPNANRVYSVADCFTFPRQLPAPVGGFATFNGTTSQLVLDHLIPERGFSDFNVSMEVRPRRVINRGWGNPAGTRPFWSQLNLLCAWGDFDQFALSRNWNLDVWNDVRIEVRTTVGPTQIALYYDDENVGQRDLVFQGFGGFDRFALWGSGTFAFWGDVRNIKFEVLTGPLPGVYLDMKCDGNLLDDSPEANHGTGVDIVFGND